MKKYLSFAIIATSVTLSACNSGGTSANSTGNATPPASGSGSQASAASNVVPIVIDDAWRGLLGCRWGGNTRSRQTHLQTRRETYP